MAVIFSIGKPFREPFYKNYYFLVSAVVLTVTNILVYSHVWNITDISLEV